jgi:oligoendopeptidase F
MGIHMKKTKKYQWNLKLLYSSEKDPRIEVDLKSIEKKIDAFARKYDKPDKVYLKNDKKLLEALNDYEELIRTTVEKPLVYFHFLQDIDAQNKTAPAQISLMTNRLAQAENKLEFFENSLGCIVASKQKSLLKNKSFSKFHVLLERIFDSAKHKLSVQEEKIMNLKSLPAYDMWIDGNERMLNMRYVIWEGKKISLAEAMNRIQNIAKTDERHKLNALVTEEVKAVAPFSEAEINAIVTNKKINDELRHYSSPYENTVNNYHNDPKVVETLVRTVTESFPVAHKFYRLKAKLLGLKRLSYCDRGAKIGKISTKFSFDESLDILKKTFGALDPKYSQILQSFVDNGQIDVFPRIGKTGGAYCAGNYSFQTFVLLNHVDELYSLSTFAHEMGHSFHTQFSKIQGPIYCHYSTSMAETASTLFEAIAFEAVFDRLSDKEKMIALQEKINDEISTIIRQIACFNFENDIHETIRKEGFVGAERLAEMHNKNMSAYLGPIFDMKIDDGYRFVQWSHIRRFFYVYSYAYGMLVSKALLRRYKQDKSFWKKIEQFLSAGGKDSPENILKEIGIDVSKPSFWKEGLKEIEDDIVKLEKLTQK